MNSSEPNFAEPAKLSPANSFLRLVLLAAVVAGITGAFAYVGGWFTPHALTPVTLINTFEKVNGTHPGFRRNHAKGVGVAGYFESNGRGVEISRAAVFRPGRVPVIGRFSLAGGMPYAPDDAHTTRSMALLFQLPDGEEWRSAMINLPVFVVNSMAGFSNLLTATAPDPATGKPDPAKMSAFMAANPEFPKAIKIVSAAPPSTGFENTTYNGLNAFLFTNSKGEVVPVRWSMVPTQAITPIDPAQPAPTDTNYLFNALIAAIHAQPLQWHLVVTLGQPGDPTADPTLPWPTDRKQIDVGTLTIDHIESESTSPVRDITFDPLILPDGIAASDDPILAARSPAYAQSFRRRESEPKSPSAITADEIAAPTHK
jgi:catalase